MTIMEKVRNLAGRDTGISNQYGAKLYGPAAKPASQLAELVTTSSINTAGPVTYTADQVLGGEIIRDCNGAVRTDTLPTAAQLIAALGGVVIGHRIKFDIVNNSGAANTLTVQPGANGATRAPGTFTVAQNSVRYFEIVFNTLTTYQLISKGGGAV